MGLLRLIRRLVRLGLAVLAVTMAAVMYFSDANLERYGDGRGLETPVDVVLVLGGGIDGDGILGYSSRRRVRGAVALLQAGQAGAVIFSGFSRRPDLTPPAGELMRDFALSIGAPPERLIVEPRASTTFENLRFGFAIARDRQMRRIALATDAYHLERARHLAAYLGHPDVGLIAVDGLRYDGPGDRVWSILREALAWWYNLGKIAGWEVLAAAGLDPDERGELIR